MVDIMQRFSTKDKEFKAHVTWKQIFKHKHLYQFHDLKLNMVHEVPLRQKEA